MAHSKTSGRKISRIAEEGGDTSAIWQIEAKGPRAKRTRYKREVRREAIPADQLQAFVEEKRRAAKALYPKT